MVRRPPLPEGFITVNGKYGLRRAVELNVPGFYALRSGFTTGTCATAAAKAALLALTEECFEEKTEVTLPDGEKVVLPIYKVEKRMRIPLLPVSSKMPEMTRTLPTDIRL